MVRPAPGALIVSTLMTGPRIAPGRRSDPVRMAWRMEGSLGGGREAPRARPGPRKPLALVLHAPQGRRDGDAGVLGDLDAPPAAQRVDAHQRHLRGARLDQHDALAGLAELARLVAEAPADAGAHLPDDRVAG